MFSDYETLVGYVDVKTASGVYFYVQRNTSYTTTGVIPYQMTQLNTGGAMNLATGTFTVPTNGRYFFSFTAQASVSYGNVVLRLNGGWIAATAELQLGDSEEMPLSATLSLKKGDQVDTYLYYGSLNDNSAYHYTQFSGILLEEDLELYK